MDNGKRKVNIIVIGLSGGKDRASGRQTSCEVKIGSYQIFKKKLIPEHDE